MIREIAYMTRWKIFDNIVHQARGMKLERNRTKKAYFKIALWILGLIAVIWLLHEKKHRDY